MGSPTPLPPVFVVCAQFDYAYTSSSPLTQLPLEFLSFVFCVFFCYIHSEALKGCNDGTHSDGGEVHTHI